MKVDKKEMKKYLGGINLCSKILLSDWRKVNPQQLKRMLEELKVQVEKAIDLID